MNPYYSEYIKLRELDPFEVYKARTMLVRRFAWAIPDMRVITELANRHRAIVEIGAGTGYWAWLLKQAHVQVMAFDAYTPTSGTNYYQHVIEWTTVYQGDHTVLSRFAPNWSLLLCWPPYSEPMGTNCLKLFKGNKVIYVGEYDGGCTGDTEMHTMLERNWTLVRQSDIPQWSGIHDAVFEYERNK